MAKSGIFKRKHLHLGLKLLVTGLALYFVFQKIDVEKAIATIASIPIGHYLIALLLFNAGRFAAALRLRHFLFALGIRLEHGYNLRLFYIGAFYNMFLPGAIGGDGYKVYLLQRRFQVGMRKLVGTMFLDRLSGVAALLLGAGIMALLSDFDPASWYKPLLWGLTLACLPVYFGLVRWWFPTYLPQWLQTTLHSMFLQLTNVALAIVLLEGLGVVDHQLDYIVLLMVGSVLAVLPLSIGGLGIREAVFVVGHEYLPVDQEAAIAFALLAFSCHALSSLAGLPFAFTRMEPRNSEG